MSLNNKPTILIVDDEPDVLFSLTGLLRRDFQVFTAESGAQALQILGENTVQVMMTDQRMPTMTGIELIQRVRCEHPHAVRIMFTGYADIRAVVEAINSGQLYRYITKPWDPDDLVQLLRDAVSKHDELAAQRSLLHCLPSYLADATLLATAVDTAKIDLAFLTQFQARTDELRADLERLQPSL